MEKHSHPLPGFMELLQAVQHTFVTSKTARCRCP